MRRAARLDRAGALTPRDLMWAAIRVLAQNGQVFSAVEVAYLANLRRRAVGELDVDSVDQYLEGLSRAQPPYIKLAGDNTLRHELKHFCLERDVGVEAPRVTRDGKPVTQGAGNEAMWAAMKTLKDFDAADLAGAASAGAVKVSLGSARSYCQWLTKAGYLVVTHIANGHGGNRYRFMRSRDTGPRPPLVTKELQVLDGNSLEVVYQGGKS